MALGYLFEKFEAGGIGTEAAASSSFSTKTLYSPILTAKPDQGVTPLDRSDELRNQDQPLSLLPEAYEPSWGDYEVRMYPDVLGFRLKHILGAPTTTAGNGVITDPDTTAIPTGAYRHVWTAPFGPAGANPQTTEAVFAYKDQSTFFKVRGMACTELGITNPQEGGSRLSAEGIATYMSRIADPSQTPAYESLAIRPFTRGNLSLPTWLSGSGTHEEFELSIANPLDAVRSMSAASRSPDSIEYAEELRRVTGSLAQRNLDPDDWDALVNATAFSAIARWVSESIIASAYPYKFYAEMPNCQYSGGEVQELGNQRRHSANFEFAATYGGSSASATFTLVNATASYA